MIEMRRIDVSRVEKRRKRRGKNGKRIDVCAFFCGFQIAIVALLAVVSNLSVIECGQ